MQLITETVVLHTQEGAMLLHLSIPLFVRPCMYLWWQSRLFVREAEKSNNFREHFCYKAYVSGGL